MFVASTTFVTSSCFALPHVEWDNIATLGVAPISCSNVLAELEAIAANCSGFGFWFSPQSANTKHPFSPISLACVSINMKADTISVPGAVLTT